MILICTQDQFVQWRLTLPRKKKLYQSESSESDRTLATSGGNAPIIQQLGQFKPGHALPRELQMTTLPEMPQ